MPHALENKDHNKDKYVFWAMNFKYNSIIKNKTKSYQKNEL